MAAEKRDYSLSELSQYNGSDASRPVLVSVKDTIFDVSASPHYKGGGGYAMFAGHDCSVALAKMDLNPEILDAGLQDLSAQEMTALDKWFDTFQSKYPILGKLIR